MIGERRYGGGSRRRSPSPRRPPPRSRDVNPPRHCNVSPNRRYGTEEYSGEAKASRRIEKKDHFEDRVPRFSAFDDRERDRLGGRRFRSPRRNEENGDFDRSVSLSSYGVGGTSRYDSEMSVVRPGRSYNEDSYHGDLSSMKLKWDHPLNGLRKADYLSMKDYSTTRGSGGADDVNISSGGDRDYYMQNPYLDFSQAGLPASGYLDRVKSASSKYESESAGKLNSHSYSLARGRVDDTNVRNSSSGDGSSHMSYLASKYLNNEADKDQYIRVQDLERNDGLHNREDSYFEKKSSEFHFHDKYLGVGKSVEGDIYKFKKEDNILSSRGYLKGDPDYSRSSSHLKDYNPVPSGILREGFSDYSRSRELHMPSSDVIQRGSGLASQPISRDWYSEKKQNMLSAEPEGQFDDTRSISRLYVGLPEKRHEEWSYSEFGRSKIDSTRHANVEEDYRDQHIFRSDVLKRTVGAQSHKEHMEDDGLWDQYPSFQVQSSPDKFDSHGSLHDRRGDVDILGAGSTHLNHGAEVYYRCGGIKTGNHHADIDGKCDFDNSDPLRSRGYGPTFGRLHSIPRKRLPIADLSLVETYESRLGVKHMRDDALYEHDVGIRISVDGNGARRLYNQVDVDDESDLVHLSKKPRSSRPKSLDYENTCRVSNELGIDEPSSSEFHPRYSIKNHKSGPRYIKKRLGPIQKLHVSQRIVKKHKPSIKKRLAPPPPKRRSTLPWIKNMSPNKMMSDQNDPDGGVQDHDGDHLGDLIPTAAPEPPEKSKEFKQLVQNAFFKFLKQINDTPVKRKTYKDQGKTCILKCFVCGSNSEEFVGTESLAMHAFTSMMVGVRSQHLGLHKALCALMGWKTTEHPSDEWHCQAMTNAEARILKEDLIIWPPVVVVHKSTIDSTSPGERVITSAYKLNAKLSDEGYSNILKVCNGKSSNQSVMLVKFNGTLSGLQEADRLHQSYIKSKHARAEFKGGSKEKSSGREDNFLYGYLGIAEDLDKLDFDTKKRCVLRSKKQILGIVDAPIDTKGETG